MRLSPPAGAAGAAEALEDLQLLEFVQDLPGLEVLDRIEVGRARVLLGDIERIDQLL